MSHPRYAILQNLLTSYNAPDPPSKPPPASTRAPTARCASFSSLIGLGSEPLPKLSPGEVDDVLGTQTSAVNVSLESIPALFNPNNQCSEPEAGHSAGHHGSSLYSGLPTLPKRACSAPAPAPPSGQCPAGRLIATSADIFQTMEPEAGEAAARRKTIWRLFPSLQFHRQRVLLGPSPSCRPRQLAVTAGGRTGMHLDPLQCRVPGCEKLFRSNSQRNQHYAAFHPEETFACPRCPLRLITKSSLDFHRRKKHQDFVRSSRECPIDGCVRKFYVESRLVHHLRVHHRQRCLPCLHPSCESRFLSPRERDQHAKREHERPPSLPCPECGRTFTSRGLLSRHRRRQHHQPPPPPPPPAAAAAASETAPLEPSPVPSTAPMPSPGPVLPPCAICEAVFTSWEQLSAHLAAHARLATDMYEQQQQKQKELLLQAREKTKAKLCEDSEPPEKIVSSNPPTSCDLKEPPLTAEIAVGTEEPVLPGAAKAFGGAGKPEVLLACPFRECAILCKDHALFREHFARHFTGEIPTDEVASLLPADCLTPVPDPLPSIPFGNPVEDSSFTNFNDTETSSLFQALDLNLLSAITEEVHDSDFLDQMLAPDLAFALTLPEATMDSRAKLAIKKSVSAPGPPVAPDFLPFGLAGCSGASVAPPAMNADSMPPPAMTGDEGCARTCPRRTQQLADLAKRRKALLLERMTLGFEPQRPQGVGGEHLKDVMRQIFHSKALPSKYPAPAGGPDFAEGDPEPVGLLAPLPDWLGVLQTDMLGAPADTPIDPPMLDQLL